MKNLSGIPGFTLAILGLPLLFQLASWSKYL